MARLSPRLRSHLFSVLLALLSVVGIIGTTLPQQSTARASAAQPATDSGTHVPVLLLHGLEQYDSANCYTSNHFNPPDEYSRWSGFLQVNGDNFAGDSWSRALIDALGYFNGDTGCDHDIGNDSNCTGYPDSNHDGYVETNNEDIRHIACRFYWYIYNNYTSQGKPVNILAHSMGGIIAEWALSMAAAHNTPKFPYPLLVYNVVTLSTPFQGVPENVLGHGQDVSANVACPNVSNPYNNSNVCFDAQQIEYDAGTPSNTPYSIIPQLNAFSSTLGYWTVIGSFGTALTLPVACDFVSISSSLTTTTGTTVSPGPSLSSAAVVYYDQCIKHEEPEPTAVTASYQDDVSTSLDYSGFLGTVSYPDSNETGSLPHPLAEAIEALAVTRGPDNLPYPVVDAPGGGNFLNDWFDVGGVNSVLGLPIDKSYSIPGGQRQDFVGGSIYWSSATGTAEVQGPIYTEYTSAFGGPSGGLGFPTSDDLGLAGGGVSYFYGNLCGARGPNNSGAAIYWTSTTGAHQVGGCIYNYYWSVLGGPGGNAHYNLGFPSSDVQTIPGGYVSYFFGNLCAGSARGPWSSGSAIYNSSNGTYMVGGCIYNDYWQNLGGPGGELGFPVSSTQQIPGGYVSYFAGQKCGGGGLNNSGSAIYYVTSAYEVQGCIYTEYQQMGGPSVMGFPTSNQYGIPGGMESDFAGAGCGNTGSTIQYSSNTGAHEIHGCIYNHYVYLIRAGLSLGFPVTDEQGIAGGRVSYFSDQKCGGGGPNNSGSAIFWTSGTGAHEVHGCIYDKYWHMPPGINGENQDGPGGALGFPLADEGSITSGCTQLSARYNPFQHGAIYFYNGAAYEVQGAIYTTYLDYGGAGGVMGLPVTDEYTYDSAGDRESEFENGTILFNKATGHITVIKSAPC